MAATSGSLFDKHSDRIEEVINKNIEVFLPSLDPVWRDTVVTSQGVGPADAIGRDMKILKTYMGSMAGVLEQGAPRGDVGLYGDTTSAAALGSRIYDQNLTQTWPSPLVGPNASPYRLGIGMRSMMSNIMFTLGELQAEAVPAFIGEVIAPKLEGFAKNVSHTLCNYWYLNQNDSYAICQISNLTLSGSGPYYATFSPSNNAVDRFYVGMRVDIWDDDSGAPDLDDSVHGVKNSTDGALANRKEVYVDYVDELKNEVRLVCETDHLDATTHQTVANDDWVLYAGSVGSAAATGFAGINSWLKSGAAGNNNLYLLGDDRDTSNQIDVSAHPEFKSFTKSSVGTLTEHKLRQYLRRYHAAKNKYGQYIDCLIASDGVWLAYEATKIGREILDRTGRLSSISTEGSQEGFQFAFDGRSYTGYTSTYVEDGSVYGIRKGGSNWKRYVPPTPSGYSTFDRADSFIPFNFVAGALTGTGTNKLPIYDSSGSNTLVTEGVQMPGLMRMQLVPDQPSGMKLTGVTTDQQFSDN
tara:strand:+ start:19981 stop:21555 length:1575 start_codon:yes stop_codon:yes gene_type:complete